MIKKFKSTKKNKEVAINLRIDAQINEELLNLVEKYGTTKSEFIRFLIEREIELDKEGNYEE